MKALKFEKDHGLEHYDYVGFSIGISRHIAVSVIIDDKADDHNVHEAIKAITGAKELVFQTLWMLGESNPQHIYKIYY